MKFPQVGHEQTRGMFATLMRSRDDVRVELRPTYFPGQIPRYPTVTRSPMCARCFSHAHHVSDCPE